MNDARREPVRWQLADLLDLEARIAQSDAPVDARDRLLFTRDIQPRLTALSPGAQRRAGLRLWLDSQRDSADIAPGAAWTRALRLLRRLLWVGMAISGGLLASGLCVGSGQRVHVVIFLALTLWLPWLLFGLSWGLRALIGREAAGMSWIVCRIAPLTSPTADATAGDRPQSLASLVQTLRGSQSVARALSARISGLFQWGGLGFSLGVVLVFVATLMVFDVRFYWEATPEDSGLMQATVSTMALPWAAFWPAAVPDDAAIRASRLRTGAASRAVPGGAVAGAWWRFLAMSLLCWGVLPRLVLLAVFAWRERRALDQLDFQAPRHRALWRSLTHIERGQTADAAADNAIVLDVGGSGIESAAIRGFMLRRLRLNPEASYRVSVLDETAEAAADRALATPPTHVVLAVLDWALSPRQAAALQQRVRRLAGAQAAITWLVMGGIPTQPVAPADDEYRRWIVFVDGLADPATEVAAYDPAV